MPTKRIIALGALALGVVLAAPAFGQQTRACIHFQLSCSDAPYPVTAPAARPSNRALYNMAPEAAHQDMQKTGMPQQSAAQPCIHAQTSCM